MSAQLYRYFDTNGVLLYVGISASALRRLTEHEHKADWFSHIVIITIERFENRKSALAAEREAIRSERPAHNFKHRKKWRRPWLRRSFNSDLLLLTEPKKPYWTQTTTT